MIIEEIDESLFIGRFKDMGRFDEMGKSAGLMALFEYLDEVHDDDAPLVLEPIQLCCDYDYYASFKEMQSYYDKDIYPDLDAFREETTVIECEDGGIIIRCF